ncbi:class I SAM-dependent methyltransferase [Methylobacterium durans]|uniref:class I SAM-dependent methyltransferase n=1 Tax=Methylobacterium durans TaxID=2202825 RepID=UPI002AFFB2A9|nr:class I SAM-dependent methyltransferase [Methylobacterium durans]MEA1833858.1 class I SAM-dependent methyltransferase [Methylobacterium durans]
MPAGRIVADAEDGMGFNRHLRRVVPSAATLTYNPVFKFASGLMDIIPALIFPDLRKIPPNYMRIRVGVGNSVFANQIGYLTAGKNFWLYMLANGFISPASVIVDIGCGCGRFAHHIRDYAFSGERFQGHYHGIDIDEEMLAWCRANFDAERFTFINSTHASATYRNATARSGGFDLPIADASADLVFSTSLYTHLLQPEVENYTREAFRVLKPGGVMAMFVFSMDHPPSSFGDRHTFRHRIGQAHVETLENPEAAVAYDEAYLVALAHGLGFTQVRVIAVANGVQQLLIARKGETVAA